MTFAFHYSIWFSDMVTLDACGNGGGLKLCNNNQSHRLVLFSLWRTKLQIKKKRTWYCVGNSWKWPGCSSEVSVGTHMGICREQEAYPLVSSRVETENLSVVAKAVDLTVNVNESKFMRIKARN